MSQALQDLLIASSPDGIMTFDATLTVTVWNPAMEKLLGVAAVEVVGKKISQSPVSELLPAQADSFFTEALRGNPTTTSTIHLGGNAAYNFFEITCFPLLDDSGRVAGGAASFRETRLQAQLNRLSSKTYIQFQDVLESMADAFVALDSNWCYTYVNRKAAATFNRTQEYLIGKHIWTEFPEGIGQPFYHSYYRAVAEKTNITLEEYYPPYDRWFENRIYPLTDGLSIFFSDVTERKKEQEALQKLNRELQRNQQVLQQQAEQITEYNTRLEAVVRQRTGELEVKQQEVEAANEELTAINEELTALNEELKTSNEQLGSAKEEVERISAEALRASEQKYAELTDTMREVFVVLNRELEYTYWNKAAEKIANRPRESAYGKKPSVLFDPERGRRYEELFRNAIRLGTAVSITEEFLSGGQVHYLEVTAYPTAGGGTFGIARNVTARVQAEQQYRELAESINDPVILLDKELRYLYMNTAAELTATTPGQVLGEAAPEQAGKLHPAVRRVLERGRKEVFTDEVMRGESLRILEVTLYPTKSGNVLMITRDVTPQVKAREQERKLNQELIGQNEQLQQFNYITSHNIRGPVATLLGLLNLIDKAEGLGEENLAIVENMEKTVLKLDGIIRDLNTILEYKKSFNAIKENISLKVLAEEVRMLLAQSIQETGASLRMDFSGAEQVFSVKSYLHSIFYNLLSNAVKFRDPDRLSVIEVRSWGEDGYICIGFSDNGRGMNLSRHREHLFGLYKRFHSQVEGKGLGLHLVKTQAEALGGTVIVESREGEGSTFTLRLPKRSRSIISHV